MNIMEFNNYNKKIDNCIGVEGTKKLSESLMANYSLTKLNLQGYDIYIYTVIMNKQFMKNKQIKINRKQYWSRRS